MRRLFIPGTLQETVIIAGADAHHLMHVMRAKKGEVLVVADEHGQAARMEIIDFAQDKVWLHFLEAEKTNTESPLVLELVQCLPKGDKMDLIVQKAVELGADLVQPVRSEYCVVKYDAKKSASRQEKWQKIAAEAAKQCGRMRHLTVAPIVSLAEWLTAFVPEPGTLLLICYENEQQQGLRALLRAQEVQKVCLLIGPEGGFSAKEAAFAKAHGAVSVMLGPRILRAETAAMAALTVLQYEKGDLGGRT